MTFFDGSKFDNFSFFPSSDRLSSNNGSERGARVTFSSIDPHPRDLGGATLHPTVASVLAILPLARIILLVVAQSRMIRFARFRRLGGHVDHGDVAVAVHRGIRVLVGKLIGVGQRRREILRDP